MSKSDWESYHAEAGALAEVNSRAINALVDAEGLRLKSVKTELTFYDANKPHKLVKVYWNAGDPFVECDEIPLNEELADKEFVIE